MLIDKPSIHVHENYCFVRYPMYLIDKAYDTVYMNALMSWYMDITTEHVKFFLNNSRQRTGCRKNKINYQWAIFHFLRKVEVQHPYHTDNILDNIHSNDI